MNTMTKKIKIVIADDHLLIAETWATLINMDPDFEVVKVFVSRTLRLNVQLAGNHELAVIPGRQKSGLVVAGRNLAAVFKAGGVRDAIATHEISPTQVGMTFAGK